MAPPVNRRTGYSRRAQYTTFFAYVAGVLGVIVGVLVLLAALANHTAFAPLRMLASDVSQPAGRVAASTHAGFSGFADTLAGYATWGPDNARLKREVALARVRAVESATMAQENQRLKAMLGLRGAAPQPVATAWLIGSSGASTRRYAIISAGARQGVRSGMPVRSPLGLVGRVMEVGQISARILLLTDSESVVPVRRASDGLPAFASGKGDGTIQIRLLSLGINPLKKGDAFVASGTGGIYWPGTPIAVVGELTHDGAIGHLLSDPAASETVIVQPAWNPVEDASLPPPVDPDAEAAKAKAEAKAAAKAEAKAAKAAAKAKAHSGGLFSRLHT